MVSFGWLSLLVCVSVLWARVSPDTEEGQLGGGYVYRDTIPSQVTGMKPQWDPNGYVFFCLCMGRFGNQADHFLGGLAFAKAVNRTLVVPPFRSYRNVRFTEWFKFDAVAEYHRVVLAEDFMEHLAPSGWPQGQRRGFCWLPSRHQDAECEMKKGNPFQQFWDGLGVDFDSYEIYQLSYTDPGAWAKEYPPDKFPVIAMKGAPAAFPVRPSHRHLQRYLVFSDRVEEEAQEYIDRHFANQSYVGIHLRNGADWENACANAEGHPHYMASPQCLENTGRLVTKTLCFPPKSEILRLLKNVVIATKVKIVFIAVDKNPMINEIKEHLKKQKVELFHADPHLPLTDLAILKKSTHFIGNCVSSFTAFVKRARDVEGKPSSFWGFS